MNTLRSRFVAGMALLGLASTAFGQSAPALRSYSSYFFFGDSLTDNGNLFAATAGANPPASVPGTGTGYFNGRYSNGLTYAEYLRSGLAPTVTAASTVKTNLNFAFAGASAAGTATLPPSLSNQVGLYQARGITAGANDLYVLLAGANDLLNAIQVPANQNATAMTNTGIAASTAVASSVTSLANLGARNIFVINLPDISKTPRFTTGTGSSGAIFMQNGVLAFNNDLRTRVGALSLPTGTNVTVFDLSAVFNTLITTPSLFGFTVVNQEYLGVLQAGGTPGPVGNYIFFDGIHPTTKAHQVLANAMVEALNPEFVLGSAGVQGSSALLATDLSLDAIDSRLSLVRYGGMRHASDGWVSFTAKSGGLDWSGYRNQFDFDASVIAAGFDTQLADSLVAGVAVSTEDLKAKLGSALGSFSLKGQMVHAYGTWRTGRWFVEGTVGFGSQDFRSIARTTALAGLQTSGKAKGDRMDAALKVGADLGFEGVHFTPFVGLRYAKAKIDGYAESNVGGLNFSFDDQKVLMMNGQLGASVDWHFKTGDMPLVINVTGVYETDLQDDTRDLNGRLANTVAATSRITLADGIGDSVKLGATVSGAISKRWGWSAGYTADFRRDGDTASQYSIALHTGF